MKLKLIIATLCIAVTVATMSKVAYGYSSEAIHAAKKSLEKISFPSYADKDYKLYAFGNLLGCYDDCLTSGGNLNSIMPKQSCDGMCVCDTTGLMEAFSTDFKDKSTQRPKSADTLAKEDKVTQICLSKYRTK